MPNLVEEITNLYSYNGSYPINPPDRIRLSSGLTKTDFSTFTSEELEAAGWTGPYTKPSYDAEEFNCEWNSDEFKFDLIPHAKPSPESLQGIFYGQRENRLRNTDWAVLPDSPLSEENLEKMKAYRQKIRDMPSVIDVKSIKTQEDLDSIVWPESGVTHVIY